MTILCLTEVEKTSLNLGLAVWTMLKKLEFLSGVTILPFLFCWATKHEHFYSASTFKGICIRVKKRLLLICLGAFSYFFLENIFNLLFPILLCLWEGFYFIFLSTWNSVCLNTWHYPQCLDSHTGSDIYIRGNDLLRVKSQLFWACSFFLPRTKNMRVLLSYNIFKVPRFGRWTQMIYNIMAICDLTYLFLIYLKYFKIPHLTYKDI